MRKKTKRQIEKNPGISFFGVGVVVASIVCFLVLLALVIVFSRLVLG